MKCRHLQAIVFDWAGTTIDYGSCAPTLVFQKVFEARGVHITSQQARGPMGMAKKEHIAAIGRIPEVALAWQRQYQRDFNEADIDSMYAQFLPLQMEVLGAHCQLIPGAIETVQFCREAGLKIGSTTGYTRELMHLVQSQAKQQGYAPDLVLCSEDTPRGRPAPYLLFESAIQLDVYPMWRIIKVDDTVAGIEAGRNAGCWNIGISRTGNLVGLTEQEIAGLDSSRINQLCQRAEESLRAAGAHYVVDSIADVPTIIPLIEARIAKGERAI